MPRYFFDVIDPHGRHLDDVGIDCEDLETARKHAEIALPDLLKELLPNGMHSAVVIEIHDAQDRELIRATILLDFEKRANRH